MLSFHNDPKIKEKYLARVREHRIADNLIQGIGWENGKGCAVGCTLESYDHKRYPIELGLPIWLAYLQDVIFENLIKKESDYWPENFLEAIPVGVCTEKVKHISAINRMDRLIQIQTNNTQIEKELKEKVLNAIFMVKNYHELELNEDSALSAARSAAFSAADSALYAALSAEDSATRSARSAVDSATRSAHSAADSAAHSAADSAAHSAADSAAHSADSAVDFAAYSARSAAYSAAFKIEAEELLTVLRGLK
jgi:hypothetical protein